MPIARSCDNKHVSRHCQISPERQITPLGREPLFYDKGFVLFCFLNSKTFLQAFIILQLGNNDPKQVFLYLCCWRGKPSTDVTCFAYTQEAVHTWPSGVPRLRCSRAKPLQPDSSLVSLPDYYLHSLLLTLNNFPSLRPSKALYWATSQKLWKGTPQYTCTLSSLCSLQ